MATDGESSSAPPRPTNDKPVVVRVKRKSTQSRLDGFWLEINERPLKRPLIDFEKLSISSSSGQEELKAKKVFLQHVETVTTSEATVDVVRTFVANFTGELDGKTKNEEHRNAFKKDNRHDQLLSKARQQHEVLAKNARFEQIWRSRRGLKEETNEKALREMYRFYDVVRVDIEERSYEVQKQEDLSLEDQRLLSSYLPMLREFLPSAAEEIESDMRAYMSQQEDYLYDYYAVNEDMNVDDEDVMNPFPLVQVDDEDFYDVPYESEHDSEDSNAEDNPRNDYPDEVSDEEEEEEEEEKEEEEGSEASDESEDGGENGSSIASRDVSQFSEDEICYDSDDIHSDYHEDEEDNGEDWRWSYR